MQTNHVLLLVLCVDIFVLFVFKWSLLTVVLGSLGVLIYFLRDGLYIALKTFPRDFSGIGTFVRLQLELRKRRNERATIGQLFTSVVRRHPNKVALLSVESGKELTFKEVDELANQIGNYFKSLGYTEGDCIGLFMPNCIEYIPFWLGLSRIGVVVALINFNQRKEVLAHSINVAACKAVICDSSLDGALQESLDDPNNNVEPARSAHRYVYGSSSTGQTEILGDIEAASKLPPPKPDNTGFSSPLIYIYTSGTTGLPKAAVIRHGRFIMMTRGCYLGFRLHPTDRIYMTMPLYHSAAGILGAGTMLLSGMSIAVRAKFSASRFFNEANQYNCTVSQYIGELARYLLAQKPSEKDRQHRIRIMFGNGMRPQIWQNFVDRFNVKQIGEFYGSTEGNTSLLNMDNKVGACGFIPTYQILQLIYPLYLIRVDEATGEALRDANGMCIHCKPGDIGEIVGKIVHGDPLKDFSGYLSEGATEKKVVANVLRKGDRAFASGDILFWDKYGYVFFKDRTGDTFRWKGENVSTTEVEGVVQKVLDMKTACVYGVEIPGTDGKAGMAAIVSPPSESIVDGLSKDLRNLLPAYALPMFLRFCQEMDTTGTFKLQKNKLRKEGFNPSSVNGDSVYYFDLTSKAYKPIDQVLFDEIQNGRVRF